MLVAGLTAAERRTAAAGEVLAGTADGDEGFDFLPAPHFGALDPAGFERLPESRVDRPGRLGDLDRGRLGRHDAAIAADRTLANDSAAATSPPAVQRPEIAVYRLTRHGVVGTQVYQLRGWP